MRRKARFRNVGAGKGIIDALDANTLRTLYVDHELTQDQIAQRFGCSRQFVSKLLLQHGISRRHPASPADPGR